MFGVLKPRLLRKLEMHTRRHMWPTESEDRCSRSVGHIKNANQLYHRTELFNCPFFKHSQWAESLSRLQNIHTVRWNVTHSTRSLVVSDNACSLHGVLLSKWHNLIDLGILTHQIEQFGLFNKYKRPHFYFFFNSHHLYFYKVSTWSLCSFPLLLWPLLYLSVFRSHLLILWNVCVINKIRQ